MGIIIIIVNIYIINIDLVIIGWSVIVEMEMCIVSEGVSNDYIFIVVLIVIEICIMCIGGECLIWIFVVSRYL